MSSQSTYRRWRSRTFGELVGQDHVTRTLLNALRTGRVHHAYLFCGPRGTGKTSTARILAKAVNCLTTGGTGDPCNECRLCVAIAEGRALDVIEVDAASNRGIDEIRDLRDRAGYAPSEARRKVYIIDEAHMLTTAAANAFLKTLEEPPPSTIFILATTEPHLLPATITSRCQRFDFRRVPATAATERLQLICSEDGIEADGEALSLIVQAAEGSLRDAQNLLDQLVAFNGDRLTANKVREGLGLVADERVPALAELILRRDAAGALRTLHGATQAGVDVRQLRKELIEHLRRQMLAKFGVGATDEADPLPELGPDEYVRVLKRLNQADLRGEQVVALPLEIAIVELALGTAEPAPAALAPDRPVGRNAPGAASHGRAARPAGTAAERPAPPVEPPSRPVVDFAERASRLVREALPTPPATPPAEPPNASVDAPAAPALPAEEAAAGSPLAAAAPEPEPAGPSDGDTLAPDLGAVTTACATNGRTCCGRCASRTAASRGCCMGASPSASTAGTSRSAFSTNTT